MSLYVNMLTSKQKKVYSAIENYIKLKGIPPTVREIGEMVGEKTPGAVQGILNRLEQKGVIKRNMGMARSIQLVSNDESIYASPVYIPEIKKINVRNIEDVLNVYNIAKYHPISPDLVKQDNKYFLIRCTDGGFSSSRTAVGDLLMVHMCNDLCDGDIAMVMLEKSILLRHCFTDPKTGKITFEADMDSTNREICEDDEIKIIGKVAVRFTRFI